jgi:capsular polysaccharide biosynthesis protein
MTSENLVLALNTDERTILPEKGSVQEFWAADQSCRLQLVPETKHLASAISPGTIGSVAGSPRPSWWSANPSITMKAVNLFKLRDTYYFPEYGVLIDQMGRTMQSSMAEASYVTPDLCKLPHISKKEEQVVFLPPKEIGHLASVAVTMPWGGLHNYGHFLIDCLSSFPLLLNRGGLRGHDFVFPALKQWHRDHLRLLGVSPIELPHKCYRAESVVFTDCMANFLRAPNQNLRRVPDMQLAALGRRFDRRRKIYLSRRGNQKRKFLSEDELEVVLKSKGFEIIQPETMAVEDQISLFAESAMVVGCTGAAFANTLYCRPGTIVVEIQPRTMHELWVRDICLQMGLKWAPYYCDSHSPEKPVVHGGKVRPSVGISFDFDLGHLMAYVDGLLTADLK